jgi:hypothetical protein
MTIQEFLRDFRNQVHADAGTDGEEATLGDAFTRRFLEMLAEAGETADADVAYFSKPRLGMRVDGYCADENEDTLDLFVSIHLDAGDPERLEKARVEQALRQLASFYLKAQAGAPLLLGMAETEPAFRLVQLILKQTKKEEGFSRIRLFILTDGVVNVDRLPDVPELGEVDVSLHVWDIARLYRWYTSGQDREQIVIDLPGDSSHPPVPCLRFDNPAADYVSFMAIFPASVLVDIYGRYGPRLLERNVRSFLQVKGEINKGIRTTILDEPERFFAYNNGLTATASEVEVATDGAGGLRVTRMVDLQIVNGGQTTASLFRAVRKDKADVSNVAVQVKLTRVRDSGDLDTIVSHISKYANSQNKVSVSDLSANDPFNRRLEELSRTIWAPAAPGTQRETKWFYERARAQYIDELGRAGTPAQKARFEREHPRNQLFGKTDVSKYELAWDQRPHTVSRGSQKCFVVFHEMVEKRQLNYQPDEQFFRRLVARKILYDGIDRLVRSRGYGGYKAQIVAYTVALLSHLTARRFDFDEIWKTQSIPERFSAFLVSIADAVQGVIAEPPGGKDVTEWYKSQACWDTCRELKVSIPAILAREFEALPHGESSGIDTPTEAEEAEIRWVATIPAETWFGIAKWAKETGTLATWQRSISFSIGKLVASGKAASRKQAVQGRKIHDEAVRLGFLAADPEQS